MSYDIYLKNESGDIISLDEPVDLRGGTFALGGTREAWLNITYNYASFYAQQFGHLGIRELYGKKASDCIPLLEKAIKALGTERDSDYWNPTAGNAGAALQDLLVLAKQCPDGIFAGD